MKIWYCLQCLYEFSLVVVVGGGYKKNTLKLPHRARDYETITILRN